MAWADLLGQARGLRLAVRRRLVALPGMSMADAAVNPLGLLLRFVLSLRYRVTATGLESIAPPAPAGDGTKTPGILILPNHPAMVDPIIVYSRLAGLAPRLRLDRPRCGRPADLRDDWHYSGRQNRLCAVL